MVYTCVSQGTSQRWRIENEDGSRVDQLYTSGDTLGVIIHGAYTFTLYSASLSDFISAVSVTAIMSLHNTRLQCTGHSSRASKTIHIAGSLIASESVYYYTFILECCILHVGTPMPPLNLKSVVETYHNHFSTVLFTWDAPDASLRVDYYQYQILSESNMISVYNTSNNSALIPEIVYNKNVTFLVLAGNCIGQSTTQMKTVNISRSC